MVSYFEFEKEVEKIDNLKENFQINEDSNTSKIEKLNIEKKILLKNYIQNLIWQKFKYQDIPIDLL